MKRAPLLTTLALLLTPALQAEASGFQLDLQGARGTARAGAVTADIDDASAAYFNPAGLAQGERIELRLGDTLVIPFTSYAPANGGPKESAKVGVVAPPHLFAAWGFSDEATLGFAMFTGYGLGIDWGDAFSKRTLVQSSSLATYTFNPTVAFRVGDRVKAGVGVQLVRGTVDLTRAVGLGDTTGLAELAAGAWGISGNAGVQVELLPNELSLGVAFRGPVNLPFEGRAHFSGVPIELSDALKDQGVSTEITLPETVAIGLAYRPLEALRVNIDATYTAWQRMTEVRLTFDDPALNSVSPKAWTHAWKYAVGAEYAVNESFSARGGVMFDQSPSRPETTTPDLPDSSRVNVALGGGYAWGKYRVDLAYQLILRSSVVSTAPVAPGTYGGSAQAIGLTLGYVR